MMNQARALLSRGLSAQSDALFQGKFRASTFRGFSSWADSSTTGRGFSGNKGAAKTGGVVFAPYHIYKGKGALSVEPCIPTFVKIESGNLRVDRKGCVLLSFVPSVGDRKYDRDQRQVFALSTTEVGSLISLGSQDSAEFFHDPSMKSSNAGQVRKTLSIKPHADGSGYIFSLNVVNNLLKTNDRLTVPVTKAEFAVLKTSFTFALPHIMGWVQLTNQAGSAVEKTNSQPRFALP